LLIGLLVRLSSTRTHHTNCIPSLIPVTSIHYSVPLSPTVPAFPCSLPQSPVVPCRPPPLTTIPTTNPQSSCRPCILVSQIAVPSSSLKTAVFRFCGRGRHISCRPVRSRALGSPSSGPCRAPGPLGTLTLVACEHQLRSQKSPQNQESSLVK